MRNRLDAIWIVLRHFYRIWRGGQVRFRLETFGVYYPAPPYRRAAWHATPSMTLLLLRRSAAYVRWVIELERIRRDGGESWWSSHPGRPLPAEDASS